MKSQLPRPFQLRRDLGTMGMLYLTVAAIVLGIFLVRYFHNQSELLSEDIDQGPAEKVYKAEF